MNKKSQNYKVRKVPVNKKPVRPKKNVISKKRVYKDPYFISKIISITNDPKLTQFKKDGIKVSCIKKGLKYKSMEASVYDYLVDKGFENDLVKMKVRKVEFSKNSDFINDLLKTLNVSLHKFCHVNKINISALLYGIQNKQIISVIYNRLVDLRYKDLLKKHGIKKDLEYEIRCFNKKNI